MTGYKGPNNESIIELSPGEATDLYGILRRVLINFPATKLEQNLIEELQGLL